MLATIFWLGTLAGCIVGIVHAVYIISQHSGLPGTNSTAQSWWRALWALVLWPLFGGYLLIMWGLAAILGAPSGWRSRRGSA